VLRTRLQMRTTVKANVGNHTQLGDTDANEILQAVAREITEEYGWSLRRREAIVSLVAPYVTGTVAVTNGSATITGTGTTWTAAMVGRAISIDGLKTYLRVATVPGATTLTLGDAQLAAVGWPLASGASKTYSIFVAEYELPADLAVVLGGTEQFPLEEVSREALDRLDPQRTSRGQPRQYALSRTRIDGSPQAFKKFIEFWPAPSVASVIRVPYLVEAPALSADTDLPACPSQLIELLGTSRAADFIYSKTGDARWANLSDRFYRRYAGSGTDAGALEKLKADDEARQPLARRLRDGAPAFTYEYLQSHDPF
jgi:hypothetical protein